MRSLFFVVSFVLFIAIQGEAFPDLIRHHYVNCSACHVAPTGGGLLTSYGRSMSRELLSASGGEREPEFLHGLLPENTMKDWLQVGGNIRVLQLHRESPERKVGTTIPMQAGLEVGLIGEKIGAVAFIGQPDAQRRSIKFVYPRYYAFWQATEMLNARVGKFTPAFGINVPYHTLPTRQGLGLGANQERDAVEAVWSGELWNFAISMSKTPPPVAASQVEKLVTAQLHRTYSDSHRLGLSLLKGSTESDEREALGLHGVFGINDRLAYLTEFDLQSRRPKSTEAQTGLFHFSQLLWEYKKGWYLYLMEEYSKTNLNDSATFMNSVATGLRYHPRPHLELDIAWFKKRTARIADRYDDLAWIMLHYYF